MDRLSINFLQFGCTVQMLEHVVVKVAVSCYTIPNSRVLSNGKRHGRYVLPCSNYDDIATGELYVDLHRLSHWGAFSLVNLK